MSRESLLCLSCRLCVCVCVSRSVCIAGAVVSTVKLDQELPPRSEAARISTVSMPKHTVRHGVALFNRGLQCAFSWCDLFAYLPCKLSFNVRTCSLSTNVISECDGSIVVFNILCKLEWQWTCALFHFKAYFARFGVGMMWLDCRVRGANCKRRWCTVCAKLICFAFYMFLCVHQGAHTVCSHHWFDRGQRRQRTRLCTSTWCMCAFVYVRVRQSGVLCVLFLLPNVVKSLTVSNGLDNYRALKCM